VFERPHHQRIAHVLAALDGEKLRQHACLFGGGTCIALRNGEFRAPQSATLLDACLENALGLGGLVKLKTSGKAATARSLPS